MLGYMTIKEAKALRFTNHGKYYGIPVYIRESDMMVATKWAPLEYLMTVFHYIEASINMVFYPNDEPSFVFLIGEELI